MSDPAANKTPISLLLIEDDEDDYVLIRSLLSGIKRTEYTVRWASSYDKAIAAMNDEDYDIVIIDYYLGERTGLEFLRELGTKNLVAPVIFLTGHGDYDIDVEAMRLGASDYLIKGQINSPLLERSIRYAISQKETEARLRQAQKMEALGTFAGGIAHDFNNILASIIGFTEMAIEDIHDPQVEKHLQRVLLSSIRARELVRQILAFSKKSDHQRAPLSLSVVVKEIVHLLRASIPSTIELTVDAGSSLDMIVASPIEIHQILMNLCRNSVLAIEEKGGIGNLTISLNDTDFPTKPPLPEGTAKPDTCIELAVRDTGVGMNPEVIKKAFDPFFTTRETGKGTGMGLAVVYGIVKDLQGLITAESQPGEGSTFRVFLPRIDHQAPEVTQKTREEGKGTERILFVDDEEILAEWGQSALERLGYTVTATTDSLEAFNTFSADPSRFDLIITDQAMPAMTGLELAARVLKVRADTPVILCTGHSETASPEKTRQIGIRELLTKPLARTELAQAIRRVLDRPQKT